MGSVAETARTPEALGRADVRRCGTLWRRDLTTVDRAWPTVAGLRLRLVAPEDEAALREAMALASATDLNLAGVRLAGGRLGVIAEDVSAPGEHSQPPIVAYGWVAQRDDTVDDLGFSLELLPGHVWIYDCATVPEMRGRGVYAALLQAICAEMARRGAAWAWIGTAPQNWASQRGIARAGFHKATDADWSGEGEVLYGAPGLTAADLRAMSDASDGGAASSIHLDAGIPWIEATLTLDGALWRLYTSDTAYQGNESEPAGLLRLTERVGAGLRQFIAAYGPQIHWSVRRQDDEMAAPTVTLRREDERRELAGGASYDEFAGALDTLAPGLPLLIEGD